MCEAETLQPPFISVIIARQNLVDNLNILRCKLQDEPISALRCTRSTLVKGYKSQ